MSDIIQSDYEQLEAIARRFESKAESAEATLRRLRERAEGLRDTWKGRASARFQTEMGGELLPALQRLAEALGAASATTRQIATIFRDAEKEAEALFKGERTATLQFPPSGADARILFSDPATGAGPVCPAPGTREWAEAGLLEAAGIDPATYDPERDYAFNRRAIERGYAYYQALYNENPEFWWMGFAYSAVQNSIYPAFLMLDGMELMLKIVEWLSLPDGMSAEVLVALVFGPGAPPALFAVAQGIIDGRITSETMQQISQEFVRMQHAIFMDMGAAHYAYQQGGIEMIRDMAARGEVASTLRDAFERIHEAEATGDESRLAEAAQLMAEHEQRVLIQGYYDNIVGMGEGGQLVLDAMSVMAVPAVPGGRRLREAVPGGNIEDADGRMQWVAGEIEAWEPRIIDGVEYEEGDDGRVTHRAQV